MDNFLKLCKDFYRTTKLEMAYFNKFSANVPILQKKGKKTKTPKNALTTEHDWIDFASIELHFG